MAVDPARDYLTEEQLLASATSHEAVFLEAAPGSGKTTVAAQRFGALRYSRRTHPDGSRDLRAVVAVSFTRSATRELRDRVRRTWGPTATDWPHQICTLDTLMADLLHDVLRAGLITWPGGHTHLDIHDSWKALVNTGFAKTEYGAALQPDGNVDVKVVDRHERAQTVPDPTEMKAQLSEGRCTHTDVRRVLHRALATMPPVGDHVMARLRRSIGALIVDEVYDANQLDLAMVRAIRQAGAHVTVIGDPWQALYGWRGATPDKVPALIDDLEMHTLPLSASFRWDEPEQRDLADALRRGDGVVLPTRPAPGLDIVLAHQWETLWTAGSAVLPLAFKSTPSTTIEAATTLLLHVAAKSLIREPAAFIGEALVTLGIIDPFALDRLTQPLAALLTQLAQASTREGLKEVRTQLIGIVETESQREFARAHATHLKRLENLAMRLRATSRLVPGLTVHQAKGMEWPHVGIRLEENERSMLASGLDPDIEDHRRLYVACTRARRTTSEVVSD
jgi:DNA helicase-2/ATP-dependent DNA helicase PcrA